jgi:hypothetical protein
LFYGLGNFTLPMAKYAKYVIGVKGDSALIDPIFSSENSLKPYFFSLPNTPPIVSYTDNPTPAPTKTLLKISGRGYFE